MRPTMPSPCVFQPDGVVLFARVATGQGMWAGIIISDVDSASQRKELGPMHELHACGRAVPGITSEQLERKPVKKFVKNFPMDSRV